MEEVKNRVLDILQTTSHPESIFTLVEQTTYSHTLVQAALNILLKEDLISSFVSGNGKKIFYFLSGKKPKT